MGSGAADGAVKVCRGDRSVPSPQLCGCESEVVWGGRRRAEHSTALFQGTDRLRARAGGAGGWPK